MIHIYLQISFIRSELVPDSKAGVCKQWEWHVIRADWAHASRHDFVRSLIFSIFELFNTM
jgi:hypothetical protein